MRRSLTQTAVLAACIILVALIFTRTDLAFPPPALPDSPDIHLRTVYIGGQSVRVTVADTPASRQKGLSGREGLARGEGMLFIFPEDGAHGIWMKDMRFAIDILWLSAEGVVVDMQKNVSPDTYPTVFVPKIPARYVIELPAGGTEAYTVRIGDIVGL